MDWIFLRHADVVVNMWASCQFTDFDMGAMNDSVAYPTNTKLPAFNPSKLFDKSLPIGVKVSSLGQTVFEFTLGKSAGETQK
jgi:hypothetical protein